MSIEPPFGILDHHFHTLMHGQGDQTFLESLLDLYQDNPEALEFIEKTYQGSEYMQTHADLLSRRTRPGNRGLKDALLRKLNDMT